MANTPATPTTADPSTTSQIGDLATFSAQNMANQIALGKEQTKDSLESSEGKAYHIQ